jgi:hypothetical protein
MPAAGLVNEVDVSPCGNVLTGSCIDQQLPGS